MCEREYIRGDQADESDILAYDAGLLIPWRVAADGTQWYRRVLGQPNDSQFIQAIPPLGADASLDCESDDEGDTDDDE